MHQKACKAAKVGKFQSSADGKIQTTRAGAISQSDYRTTEMLAKKGNYLLPVCQILWHFTEGTAKKVTVRFFAFFVHIDVRKYRKKKPRVRWAFLGMCRLLNKLASSVHMQATLIGQF